MKAKPGVVALLVVVSSAWLNANGFHSSVTGFLLNGSAQHALDPENPSNDVIRINTTSPPECSPAGGYQNCVTGSVSRKINTKIQQLDNMLEFKSYFQNRSCGVGSPRIQLAIDLNGDGVADGNAFGHVAPPYNACLPNRWQYDDVTDELPRWDVSQLVASGFPAFNVICTLPIFATNPAVCPFVQNSSYIPWAVFEAVLTALFPLHRVCTAALVDDSGWSPPAAGVAYYDVISMGRKTWYSFNDTAGRGFARGCVALFHCDDDKHDGDKDHDHDYDDHDDWWDHDRKQRWGQG
jgi:hypothetical protein